METACVLLNLKCSMKALEVCGRILVTKEHSRLHFYVSCEKVEEGLDSEAVFKASNNILLWVQRFVGFFSLQEEEKKPTV